MATDRTEALYNRRILRHASRLRRMEGLRPPYREGRAVSRLCGSKASVRMRLDASDVVIAYSHEVRACVLGQATSAIVSERIVGCRADEIRRLRDRMRAMLADKGDPPDGKWSELESLLPAREFKARHASTMLILDAAVNALDASDAEASRTIEAATADT